MTRRQVDRGSATVLAAVGAAGLLVVLVVGLQIAGASIARHRAEAAADLAALAGAAEVLDGRDAACGRAGRIASANGASIQTCEVLDLDLRVTVRIAVNVGPIGASAIGRGRAGPLSHS